MKAMDKDKHMISLKEQSIGLSSVHNCRELGNYRIGDKRIKPGLLIRSANLAALTDEDAALLCEKYRLRRIYDFRSDTEKSGSPDRVPEGVSYVPLAIEFVKGDMMDVKDARQVVSLLMDNAEDKRIQSVCDLLYDNIFFEECAQQSFRVFFQDLINNHDGDGAVLWHCTQGKDRAGCASALLLLALGADRELIMKDFELTRQYYTPFLSILSAKSEAQKKVLETLLNANPAAFSSVLDKIEQRYGSLMDYMEKCLKINAQMREILRERYLEAIE